MKPDIRLRALALGFGATLWAVQSAAGSPAPKVPDGQRVDFINADKNRDARISKEEALRVPGLASAFEMLDSDRDEMISPAEFSGWSRAGRIEAPQPGDPATAPSGSAGSQHMPKL